MQRFKNILVVYNNAIGDDATLSRATALAVRNQARLTVAEVFEEPGADEVVEQRQLHLERRSHRFTKMEFKLERRS